MAHQKHNIPWNLLASNLEWHKGGLRDGRSQSSPHEITNLRARGKPTQGKEIAYFIEAFARTIDEYSDCERKKFPETYDAPNREDIILDDRIVKKITPTVRRLRNYACDSSCPSDVCWLKYHGDKCRCIPIPDEARKMSAFLRSYRPNPCYEFFYVNKAAFFQLQLVETLILYGEMDAVLRICAHPEIGLKKWWLLSECYCYVSQSMVFKILEGNYAMIFCQNLWIQTYIDQSTGIEEPILRHWLGPTFQKCPIRLYRPQHTLLFPRDMGHGIRENQ